MKSRPDRPRHLDVEGFAKAALVLQGDEAVASLPRLLDMAHPVALQASNTPVRWRAEGESRPSRGGHDETWLHLVADTVLPMVCQRCLEAVDVPVHAQRSIRFVIGEALAAELDAELDDDVLELPRSLDLHDLVEDELLLALPLVPRHEVCPQPLPAPANAEPAEERVNPFAALAALKRDDRLN